MAGRKQREEIRHAFESLDQKSQCIALHIARKFGHRFAFKYILRTHKSQCSMVPVPTYPGFFSKIFQSGRRWMRSFFTSDDSEDDSRNLVM
jgi:hypothetical protein